MHFELLYSSEFLLRLLALFICCALRTFYGRRVRIWIEAELKAGMSEHRRKVLDSKRILLFQEMLKDINYDDMNVVQELVDGATLTGEIPVTGVLDTKLKPARIDIDELMSISDQVKQQIRSRTVSSGDHDMDKLLWEKTVEEAGKGQLSGPYSFDSLPQDCLVSSRFPLLQGGKLRPIDNYSSSLINAAG